MSSIFSDISGIVSKLSTGPASVLVVEISSNVRYAIVQPYNFYFINDCKTIKYLLTASRLPSNADYNAVEFFISDNHQNTNMRYIKSDKTINEIYQYLITNKYYKFVLFKEVKAYTIEQLLNKILEMGIFTIQ